MSGATFEDAFNLLCGHKIGNGIHRTVYECRIRPDLVVKVEDDDHRDFANVMEDAFWADHQFYRPVSRWLAPCAFLSPDGRILLQKRCDPIVRSTHLPEKLPGFLTDVKTDNFGTLDGKVVCFDYALNLSTPSVRMRKARWGRMT